MVISVGAEKASEEIKHPFMTKCSKVATEGDLLQGTHRVQAAKTAQR